MSVVALALGLLGATVEYRAEFRTVPPEFPEEVRATVEATLAARGRRLVLAVPMGRDSPWSGDRLELEVVGAVTVARVILRRVRADPSSASPEVVQLEGDLPWAAWRASLASLLDRLYPAQAPGVTPNVRQTVLQSTPPPLAQPAPKGVERPTWPLWICGAGALSLGLGIGFGLKSHLDIQSIEDGQKFDPEGATVLRRASDEANVANVFLISGGIIVASGLLLYILGGN